MPNCIEIPGEAKYELHAIDVGTGLSVLVRSAGCALLYDAGSNDARRDRITQCVKLGWVVGFEPTTFGTTIRRSTKLSYTHHNEPLYNIKELRRPQISGSKAGSGQKWPNSFESATSICDNVHRGTSVFCSDAP